MTYMDGSRQDQLKEEMARKVDIWWVDDRLKAFLRWTNKKGGISFYLRPSEITTCDKCPFNGNPICRGWKSPSYGNLCNKLWDMDGNNKFCGRNKIIGWQPEGPIERGKKKKDKF